MVDVRVTIDSDSDSSLSLLWCVFKGYLRTGKMPEKVRKSQRGYHIIWKGIDMTEKECIKARAFIGDDSNRLKMDLSHINNGDFRLNQVLFTEKTTTCLKYCHPVWFSLIGIPSPNPHFTQCPKCLKTIKEASKIWEEDRKEIEIVHEDGTKCVFPLERRKSVGLHILKSFGITIV